jgi:hypothetical protein
LNGKPFIRSFYQSSSDFWYVCGVYFSQTGKQHAEDDEVSRPIDRDRWREQVSRYR